MKLTTIGIIMMVLGLVALYPLMFEKPEIRKVENEWGAVNGSVTEIITKVHVYNPYPVSLPVKSIRTEVYMNGIKMGEGSAVRVEISPRAESLVVVSTKINNSLIPEWWVSHILNGERSVVVVKGKVLFDFWILEWEYPIEMSRTVTTSILSGFSLKQVQQLCIKIENFNVEWGTVSEKRTGMRVSADVHNDCMGPLVLKDVYYSINVNGVKLGEGVSKIETTVQPNSKRVVTFEMEINNQMLEKWWIRHIENGELSRGEITIQPLIEFAGRSFRIPIVKSFDFTTNLLSD